MAPTIIFEAFNERMEESFDNEWAARLFLRKLEDDPNSEFLKLEYAQAEWEVIE
jgi:hypothetical protein